MDFPKSCCAFPRYLVVLLFAAPSFAVDADDGVDGLVRSVAQDDLRGRINSLSLAKGLSLIGADRETRLIPTADLIQIDVLGTGDPGSMPQAVVELGGGDRIHGKLVDGSQDAIVIETGPLGRVSVPIECVKRIRTARAFQPAFRSTAAWFERSATKDEDAVLLTNGDVVSGFVGEINRRGILLETVSGEARIEYRLIVAVKFSQPIPRRGRELALVITTVNADRLTALDFDLVGGRARGQLWFGASIDVPPDRLKKIEVIGGRWQWLAELEPISHTQLSMLTLDWPFHANRNVLGESLVVAGERFAHGIGVHSRSVLIYDLKGRYKTFVTRLGLDDASGPLADVDIAIVIDGKRRFERVHVKRGELIGPIRVDVSKARSMELICDFGDHGDIQDRFNWIEPGLVR